MKAAGRNIIKYTANRQGLFFLKELLEHLKQKQRGWGQADKLSSDLCVKPPNNRAFTCEPV